MSFPSAFFQFLCENTLVFIKGGTSDHDFLDIWMVEVDGRVFARSWNKSKRSWFTAFQETGVGSIRFDDTVMEVKGVHIPADDPIHSLIDKAYLNRFTDPKVIVYAEGIAKPEYHPFTMEFLFLKTR